MIIIIDFIAIESIIEFLGELIDYQTRMKRVHKEGILEKAEL